MSYFVTCTFDLKNASRDDYTNAYAELSIIGLKKTIVAGNGSDVVAPTTMVMGKFDGDSAAAVRDSIAAAVTAAFTRRRFTSEVFVVSAGNWAWGGRTT
jgi:hypothetical protein